eukprot:TRINITY_DN63900_c0_g2_i1.p1 TRINITY_DN63900_c0_g2~~TRINITY_DN63900_c0_g2_i1.p1  ORF type:complete len:496 (-),score=67.67 TRINITY_DN63900_c0_g2_i1:194-1681(-)
MQSVQPKQGKEMQHQVEHEGSSVWSSHPRFSIRHKVVQAHVKGEDVVFVRKNKEEDSAYHLGMKQYQVYCVCDWHQGVNAARFVEERFIDILDNYISHYPAPTNINSPEGLRYASLLRRALTIAFVQVDREWRSLGQLYSGCTFTAAVITGTLLTVANVGDSHAILTCSDNIIRMSADHRVQNNDQERERVVAQGSYVASISQGLNGPAQKGEAGVGPLRVWPGGLCISRALGDVEVGPSILPTPYIKQIILPEEGSRLILASDGLWDALKPSKVARISRIKTLERLSVDLINLIKQSQYDSQLNDDTSIITVDILPKGDSNFKESLKRAKSQSDLKQQKKASLFCMCGATPVSDQIVLTGTSMLNSGEAVGRKLLVAEEDMVAYYSQHTGLSQDLLQLSLKKDLNSDKESDESRKQVMEVETVNKEESFGDIQMVLSQSLKFSAMLEMHSMRSTSSRDLGSTELNDKFVPRLNTNKISELDIQEMKDLVHNPYN